ncbi:hypothetical protein [Nonomuraea sp. NPDC049695]
MSIVVTAATRQLGRLVIDELLATAEADPAWKALFKVSGSL